jgi:hypothetical protein
MSSRNEKISGSKHTRDTSIDSEKDAETCPPNLRADGSTMEAMEVQDVVDDNPHCSSSRSFSPMHTFREEPKQSSTGCNKATAVKPLKNSKKLILPSELLRAKPKVDAVSSTNRLYFLDKKVAHMPTPPNQPNGSGMRFRSDRHTVKSPSHNTNDQTSVSQLLVHSFSLS